MRRVADPDRIQRFMAALAVEATRQARLYFIGGATAVLLGWRASTIDVDIHIVPDDDRLLRALPWPRSNEVMLWMSRMLSRCFVAVSSSPYSQGVFSKRSCPSFTVTRRLIHRLSGARLKK
jgi:hypothetical protein